MSTERHQLLTELFLAACEVEPADREAFLDRECADDSALKIEVEALLRQDAAAEEELIPSNSSWKPTAEASRSTPRIDGYKIGTEIHRGGQGAVYKAIQLSTHREVALKVELGGPLASESARKRFDREVAVAAQLRHPNIVTVLDSGETADGFRFFAMDYIRGVPLNRYVREQSLTMDEVVEKFRIICDAVQYAHSRGVIHRDLKPSNILVDSDGNPMLLDFGLAKLLTDPKDTIISVTGQVLGTLPYMSPEQARGNPDEIDTRTDIYALGVILYELMTGTYPYPVIGQMADVLRHISETPPVPPSRSWTVQDGVPSGKARHKSRNRCPIGASAHKIVMKTLAKEKERRYQSVAELLKDLAAYLNGEPIEAQRDSIVYLVRVIAKRYRPVIRAALLVLVVAAAVGVWQQNIEIRRSQAETLRQQAQALCSWRAFGLAQPKLQEARNLDSDSWKILYTLAVCKQGEATHITDGRARGELLREASTSVSEALILDGDQPYLWNAKSEIVRELGRITDAVDTARRAVALGEDLFQASSNLAKALAIQQDLPEALSAAVSGTEIQDRLAQRNRPEPPQQWEDGVWLTRGTIELHLEQPAAAESIQRAIQIDNRDTRNHLLYAKLLLTFSGSVDYKQALREAEAALLNTSIPNPKFKRVAALACLKNAQLERATELAQAAERSGDEAAYPLLIAAIATAKAGLLDDAKVHLKAAVNAWPEQFALPSADRTIVTAVGGLLWFDTETELLQLRADAETAIAQLEGGTSP